MKTLLTPLYDYQEEAVKKMLRCRVGALYMDMGTGKTRVAIELIFRRQHNFRNIYWFCPCEAKETIKKEFEKHFGYIPNNLFVVGLETLGSSKRTYLSLCEKVKSNDFIVVDESHLIRSLYAKRANRLIHLSKNCYYKLCLTGTPISSGIENLYQQMKFLSPKILGYNSWFSFRLRHLTYSDRYPGMITSRRNEEFLLNRIKPYVYLVTKEACLSLPEKVYEEHWIKLTKEQKKRYNELLDSFCDEACDGWSSYTILRLFSSLQRIVSGYDVVDNKRVKLDTSNKISALLYNIDRFEGKPCVIWVKYHEEIKDILEAIPDAAVYHGNLSSKEREENRSRWLSGKSQCLVIMLGLGTSLNWLMGADYIIYYSNSFRFIDRLQSEDRTHRIGITSKKIYVDIWADCGIDSKIRECNRKKMSIVNLFRDDLGEIKDWNKFKSLLRAR